MTNKKAGQEDTVAQPTTKGMIQEMKPFSKHEFLDTPDEELLVLSQQNPEVFAILVERYEDAFLRKARTIVFSKEDAEEVVQDTFTRIYVYANKYRTQEGARFSSWAYMILTRLAFTRYQKLKKKNAATLTLDPEIYEQLPDKESFLETFSVSNEVLTALAQLPETAARVLKLQYLEGKTQDEIATEEGSTVSAIKTRIHRAKKLLKQILTKNSS